jgi:hypothetical protein
MGRICEDPRNSTDLEGAPRRTTLDPQRLVKRPVGPGVVVAELLLEPLLRPGIEEMGRRGVGLILPLFQARCGSDAR